VQITYTILGDEIIATGRRSYFYSVDVRSGTVRRVPNIRGRTEKSWEHLVAPPATSGSDILALLGSNGYIVLISSKTKQLIGTMMTNSTVRSASFSSDGQTLTTIGDDGEIYVWDSRTRACRFRKPDVSGINGTAIALSPNNQFLATGGTSGVVNVYAGKDLNISTDSIPPPSSSLLRSPLNPLQSLFNLTTPVHSLTFNHDSSILAMSSQDLKDQLKLIHMPSLTAFSNWPTSRTPLHVVTSVTFSPHSGYIAIGNDRGRVLLYRLSHFQSV
jgi:U3 small nucleolar RNA-associated protein 18